MDTTLKYELTRKKFRNIPKAMFYSNRSKNQIVNLLQIVSLNTAVFFWELFGLIFFP